MANCSLYDGISYPKPSTNESLLLTTSRLALARKLSFHRRLWRCLWDEMIKQEIPLNNHPNKIDWLPSPQRIHNAFCPYEMCFPFSLRTGR